MLFLRKPSAEIIRNFLIGQGKLNLTYSADHETFGSPPAGFVSDHTRIKLGSGQRTFEAAKSALRRWDQFRLGWLEAAPAETPIEKGRAIAIVAKAFGLWWLNACKIVRVIDEEGSANRFGFTNGTLPDHAGIGEEQFLIEWDHADNSVWYDILAFSRPNHLLARIGYPMFRATQKRFGHESSAAMCRAVE